MAQIPKTVIATSDPLSICNGFALFPALTTFRTGYVGTNTAGTICDIGPDSVLLYSLTANATYLVVFGICGPAYAIKMDLEGSTSNGTVVLTMVDDDLQAGILFGLTLTLAIDLSLDYLALSWVYAGWNSHFKSTWTKLVAFHLNSEFDVIEVIWDLIKLGFEKNNEETVITQVPTLSNALVGSWGMYDERANTFAANGGEMIVAPTLNLPIDISGMIPPIAELNMTLKAIFSHLAFGPLIGVQIPVTVKMKTVSLDKAIYSNLTYTDDGNDGTVSGTTTGPDPSAPNTLAVELDHTAGFDLAFGVFLNLNLVKLFNVGFSITWPLLKLLGIEPAAGPYANSLSNTIGMPAANACRECGTGNAGVFDVIFEAPGV